MANQRARMSATDRFSSKSRLIRLSLSAMFFLATFEVASTKSDFVELKSHKVTGPADQVHVDTPHRRTERSLFSVQEEQGIIDLHNDLRRVEYSSDMEFMTSHAELTKMAEEWAERCVWEHGQPYRDTPPFAEIGQNLYAFNGTFDPLRGVQLWFDEYVYYDYDTGACSKEPCGHYTQMVWSSSRRVGCAFAYCPSMAKIDLIRANYLVCNYGPAGNWVGQKPFKKGPECTQCENGRFWCDNGLCKRSCTSQTTKCDCKASCRNCGLKIDSDCSCACQAGWTGPNCAEPCRDNHEYCGANPGWPKSYCDKDSVRNLCLAFCEICEVQPNPPVSCTTNPPPATSSTPQTRMAVPTHPSAVTDPDLLEVIPDEGSSAAQLRGGTLGGILGIVVLARLGELRETVI